MHWQSVFSVSCFAHHCRPRTPLARGPRHCPSKKPLKKSIWLHCSNGKPKTRSALTQANGALAKARSLDDQESVAIANEAVTVSTAALQKIETERKAALARLAGIENDLAQVQHAVPNLAADPRLAEINSLALDEVNGRIARIQKIIQILGKDNPEWDKERDWVRGDMHRDHQQIAWAALNLMTLGLAESGKYLSELNAKDAETILGRMDWSEVQAEKAYLVKLNKTWVDRPWTHGSPTSTVSTKLQAKDIVKYSAILRDAISDGKELYVHAKETGATPETWDKIYHGSVTLGGTAIIFVQGIGGKVAPVASAAANAGEIGLLFKNLREEDEQIGALDGQAYDRHKKIRELDAKLADLEERQAGLKWGSQRAGQVDK